MIAVDTNILAYAEGIDDTARQVAAREVMQRLPGDAIVIPLQALGELFNVLVRRGWPVGEVRDAISVWHRGYVVAPTTEAAMIAAMDLAADHRLNIWDSVMMSVAAENGCRLMLSEDMQDGFTWRGVTVANPFAVQQHPLLVSLLDAPDE
jgi:predicted nucleic acid-binding protein